MLGILLTILIFGVIINIHELGHFFFAKLFDVKVNEFSFGMGPQIFSKTRGETTYSIRAFPIGGYVAMEGEDSAVENSGGRAFCDKKPWQRLIILLAGSAMNLFLGFVIIVGITLSSSLIGTNQIRLISDEKLATVLQPNDKIISINSHATPIYDDVIFQLLRDSDGIVNIKVERMVNDKPTQLQLDNVTFPSTVNADGKREISLGMKLVGLKNSITGTPVYALQRTGSIIKQVWFSLVDIATGRYGLSQLSGPIGTAQVVSKAVATSAGVDFSSFFTLFAFITLNVGVFNLLPLPALDGGRIVFVLLEMLFKKPVSQKYEGYIHAAGMVLLLGFMLVITVKDIVFLF